MLDKPIVANSLCMDGKRIRHADCHHCAIRKKMLFADLDLQAADAALAPINNLLVKPGVVLYQQGDAGTALYSVRKGLVKLVQTSADGYERIVHIAGPGSCIGMEGVLHERYHQSAHTVTETDVCVIPVTAALTIADTQPVLYLALMKRWQQQFAMAERWMIELGQGSMRQKLARLLLLLDDVGQTHGEIRLLNNQDSASILGSTVETVSRCVAQFKRNNILQKTAPAVYRLDRAVLSAIGQGDQ